MGLCGRMGYLPSSYLLSDKFDLSGMPRASGGCADVWMGVFKGKEVAVKILRVSEVDDEAKIRKVGKKLRFFTQDRLYIVQRFCKEVAMWRNLSHPNVLSLIGVPDTLGDGRFSMVSEWMVNGNIADYVRSKAGNHLKLVGYNFIFLYHSLDTFHTEDLPARRFHRGTKVSSQR